MEKIGFNCGDFFYKDPNHSKTWDAIVNSEWWNKTTLLYQLNHFIREELEIGKNK